MVAHPSPPTSPTASRLHVRLSARRLPPATLLAAPSRCDGRSSPPRAPQRACPTAPQAELARHRPTLARSSLVAERTVYWLALVSPQSRCADGRQRWLPLDLHLPAAVDLDASWSHSASTAIASFPSAPVPDSVRRSRLRLSAKPRSLLRVELVKARILSTLPAGVEGRNARTRPRNPVGHSTLHRRMLLTPHTQAQGRRPSCSSAPTCSSFSSLPTSPHPPSPTPSILSPSPYSRSTWSSSPSPSSSPLS